MKTQAYELLEKLGEDYWYFEVKRRLFAKILKRHKVNGKNAIDLGAGWGSNLGLLKRFFKKVEGLEIAKEAIIIARKRKLGKVNLGDATTWTGENYDCILISDLLEHVDDRQVLTNIYKSLKKGGYGLISIPAHQFLWSRMDDLAQHKRRYTISEIKEKLENQKFQVVFINYWQVWPLIPQLIYLWLFEKNIFLKKNQSSKVNLQMSPKWANSILILIGSLEHEITIRLKWPIGVGIVALVRK